MDRLPRNVVPSLRDGHVPRPHLGTLLDAALERRVTLVVGGAGWGKTTTVAAWAGRQRSAWLAIDADDADLDRLVGALLQSLRLHVPRLPADLPTALSASLGPQVDDAGRADAFAAAIGEVLHEQLERGLVLVLDDVHELEPGGPSMRLIEGLCRRAPTALHLVLVSRQEPPFSLQRLRGQGGVLDVDIMRFAFSVDEAVTLLGMGGERDERGLATALIDATAGWPAAVRLAVEAVREVPTDRREATLRSLREPGGRLVEYLAEEVYGHEPVPVQDALRIIVSLGRVSGSLCAGLGIVPATTTLQHLARRGLIEPAPVLDDGWAATRPVQDVVRTRFPLPVDDRRQLQRRVAAWYIEHGHEAEALRQLAGAGDHGALAEFLREHGVDLVQRGEGVTVLQVAGELPAAYRDAAVERVLGEASHVRGDWVAASQCYQRAAAVSPDDAGLAWRIGQIHLFRGELDEALAAYAQARLTDESTVDEALLLSWTATAHWLRGDYDAARPVATRAAAAADRCRDLRAVAASHTVLAMLAAADGDRRANDAYYLSALDAAQQAGDVLQMLRIRVNRASHYVEEGLAREALQEVDIAIPLAEMTGYTFFHALALNNRALAEELLGRLDEAAADYTAARDLYQRVGSRMVSYSLAGLGRVHTERGETVLARAAFEEALVAAEAASDAQGLVGALVGMTRVLAAEDPAAARTFADRAVTVGGPRLARALLARGWLSYARGDLASAAADGQAAAEAARMRRDLAALAESLELTVAAGVVEGADAIALLDEAIELWQSVAAPIGAARVRLIRARSVGVAGRDDAARAIHELQRLGVRLGRTGIAGPFAALPPSGATVSVSALGAFRVERNGVPVPLTDWKSKKARDLVKMLVVRRGHPVAREQLMDLLWPDEDSARLGSRLSVLLSTVRTVLQPEREAVAEGPIVADRAAVWLDLDQVEVDVERFLGAAAKALDASRRGSPDAMAALFEAENRYGGEFLAEDPYAEWAVGVREEARAAYISVLRALIRLSIDGGDTDGAVRYGLRLLEQDRFDEEAHLLLTRALAGAGRHGEAHRRYAAYVACMAEINIEPALFPAPVAAG